MKLAKITWNEGHDTYLTEVESEDVILKAFFEIEGWQEIHSMSKCVALHANFYGTDCGFSFKTVDTQALVEIYTPKGESQISEIAFMNLALYLFELLISGANENHHTIRYEPWWHDFTSYMFQIQEQIASH